MNALRVLAIAASLSGCLQGHSFRLPAPDEDAGVPDDGGDVRTTIVQPLGLITRPNKYGQYPPGGMEIARNVMMRDKGILRAFPDVTQWRADSLPTTNTIRRLFPGATSLLTIGNSGSTWLARWVTTGASNAISMPTSFTLSEDTAKAHVLKARERFIFTNTQDPLVLDSEGDTTARYAGINEPLLRVQSGTLTNGQAIEVNKYYGYRAIIKRTQSDGYVLTSPPSPQLTVTDGGAGATTNTTIRVSFSGAELNNVIAGDVVELYRTRGTTTYSTGDTHYLAKAVTLAAGDITSAYVDILDTTPERLLGVELYTNPGQTSGALSGAQRAETPPPVAYDIAQYRDTTFYASSSVRSYFKTRVPSGPWGRALSTTAERTFGIGLRSTTGNVTNGSAAITVVANTTGVVIGQLVYVTTSAQFYTVTNIVGATVTMSGNATATQVGDTIIFYDQIEVNGTIRAPDSQDFMTSTYTMTSSAPILQAYNGTYIYNVIPGEASDITIRHHRARVGAMTIRATNGQNYSPPLPEITGTVVAGLTDPRTNRIHWSLGNQPEAVPPLNYAYVGNGVIHRLIATRDALWIFASDGLFRLAGAGGVWRIDPVDPTLVLAARKAVTTLGQDVWAYTNRGLVVITSEGLVTKASEDTLGDVLPGAQFADTWDTFMTADEKHGEVLLTIRTTTTSLTYVYNTRTGAFTTFEPSAATTGQDIANDAFAITEMVPFPAQDSLVFAAATGAAGVDADTGYFGSDTAAARFLGDGQIIRFHPVAPQGEPFSLVQFLDVGWLFEGAETLSVTPTFGSLELSAVTIADGGAEDRLTVWTPRSAAINQRVRPGMKLFATAQNWSMRGMSIRWTPLSAQGKR